MPVKRLIPKVFLAVFLMLIWKVGFAQDYIKLLQKGVTSADSSDYFFSLAKSQIKNDADQAEFDFAKNAYFSDHGILDSSIYYGEKALTYFRQVNELNKMIYVRNNMAKAYRTTGNYELAIELLFETLPLAEDLKSLNWQGWLLQSIANNYHDFSSYEKGVFYGKKSHEISLQNLENDPMSVVWALNVIAINYDDWGKYDSALFFHSKVMELKSSLDTLQIGFTYNNIGNTLIKLNRLEEAKPWIQTAIRISEINSESGISEDYDLATYYTNLGRINTKTGNLKEAGETLTKGKFYSLRSQSQEKIGDNYEALYEFFKNSQRPDSALFYHELLTQLNDSIFNEKNAQLITETETKYQVAEKERILAEEKLKTQRITFGAVALGIFLMASIGIGFLTVKQQKLKNRQQQQEIEFQKIKAQVDIQNRLQEQRFAISRDLHDNIGVQLTFIILSVDQLKKSLQPLSEKALHSLDSIKTFTQTTIIELRDTIWAMNRHEMNFADLKERLWGFIEKAKFSETVDFNLEMDEALEEMKLSSFEGITIYRIIQECVHNGFKHAKAGKISISLRKKGNEGLEIQVEDDGKGFSLEEAEFGNGLLNLKKRVSDLKGKIDIESTIHKGTKIRIELPDHFHDSTRNS
jgi:signal transduction histidine kinase